MIPFRTIIHADWSVARSKRWMCRADIENGRWTVSSTVRADDLMDTLASPAAYPLLAGFDFPIGLPWRYGQSTGYADFRSFLNGLDDGAWSEFRTIAREPSEISQRRPFYPAGAAKGIKQLSLLEGHAACHLDELRRQSELATPNRRAACPIFWTLGGNQVGRGALTGWEEVLRPCLAAGASLWPFEGSLSELVLRKGLVLAETYPAEAYGHVGVKFGAGQSKTRQNDRRGHVVAILDWAALRNVAFTSEAAEELHDGFGPGKTGEDRFDAMMGALGMIEVVVGGRLDAPGDSPERCWEGWILGQR